MLLTVAIPTYNRNEILLENLKYLLPQLNHDCELLILDNCSPTPVLETIQGLCEVNEGLNWRVVRHQFNVGGDENTFRCVEHAKGEYIWWLGDDDRPDPCAIGNIFNVILSFNRPEVVSMSAHINGHVVRSEDRVGHGSASYLSHFKYLSEAIFISCMVFKREVAQRHMVDPFHLQTSCAGQLYLMCNILRDDETRYCISMRPVITEAGHARETEEKVHMPGTLVGLQVIPLLPWNTFEQQQIARLCSGIWLLMLGIVTTNYLFVTMLNDVSVAHEARLNLKRLRASSEVNGFFSKLHMFYLAIGLFVFFPKLGKIVTGRLINLRNNRALKLILLQNFLR